MGTSANSDRISPSGHRGGPVCPWTGPKIFRELSGIARYRPVLLRYRPVSTSIDPVSLTGHPVPGSGTSVIRPGWRTDGNPH